AAVLVASLTLPALAGTEQTVPRPAVGTPSGTADATVDRIFYREAQVGENLRQYSPMVETYIQNLQSDKELGKTPKSDKYFLGRMELTNGITQKNFEKQPRLPMRVLDRLNNFYRMSYVPTGFMELVLLQNGFTRDNYDLKFLRREFLGDVRCLVFDAVPKPKLKGTHFIGRIWVEDQDYTIVRFNGTYEPQTRMKYYFHFDSWRLNVKPGEWLPAYVYTEETDTKYAFIRKLAMKGQTRLWGYDLKTSGRQGEFTDVVVDAPPDAVTDKSESAANEINPLESQHIWEREAEDNVLDRLERAGLLAPAAGDVTKVLQTVVNNLEITNNLSIQPDVRCRVLLTTPLESFTIGHTIVISRGLLDVLPDEPALAMVLGHELGHIVLGHQLDTKYAFSDRMIFPDEQSFRRLALGHTMQEEQEADTKGMEFLKNSPYKDKLGNAGLFLRALEEHSRELPALITPHYGNRIVKGANGIRMADLMQNAPQIENKDLTQVAALPLGSRIKLNPWNDQLELQKSKAPTVASVRDKLPFEITPLIPNLARYRGPQEVASAQNQGK
ncbi:MAG: M48 family metalloprotease, partial [Acidobacteria bacterium]|nr:M48 family metalloprotease [Acidobacteriota bacterium]